MSVGRGVDLKNDEEVKEYLENLGTEYRFSCYYEKEPKGCHLLADYLLAIKNDAVTAFQVYLKNCDVRNFAHSCHKVAGFRSEGLGCEKDTDLSYDYFVKGCELGFPRACFNAGLMDTTNIAPRRRPQSFKAGAEFMKKGCDGDIMDSCYKYSGMMINGFGGVVEKNLKEAFEASKKGCQLGHMASCHNVSLMYARGDGCEADLEKSKIYRNAAEDMRNQMKDTQRTQNFQRGVEENS